MNRLPGIAASIALAMLVVGGFETHYLRVFTFDAARTNAAMTELPYRKLPGLRRLLAEADRSTPRGARIAIALPFRTWEEGYGYGYDRASFMLPGKQVVPLLALNRDELQIENLRVADYIVIWKGRAAVNGFAPLWTTEDGTLMARRR